MMSLDVIAVIVISVLIIMITIMLYKLTNQLDENKALNSKIKNCLSDRKSSEVRLGKIGEQFAPFIDGWPYEPENFRFIGGPIDGIQFDRNCVLLVEIKTGKARLSYKQRRIKNLIKDGKFKFVTLRINENGTHITEADSEN